MPLYTDGTGRALTINHVPARIVSLVPSQTELLFHLGLEEAVVGITKFCIHPDDWYRTKPRVGGTKDIRAERIHALRPDLIIANREENVRVQVEDLMPHYPVWVTDVHDLNSALEMIRTVGKITGKEGPAIKLSDEIQTVMKAVHGKGEAWKQQRRSAGLAPSPTVAYLIWKDPFLTVGSDTFIHHLLQQCGLRNAFGQHTRYPEVSLRNLQEARPDYVFLSSEPYPFRQKHVEELAHHLPHSRILQVDGEMFSWYGSRLLKSGSYLSALMDQLI